MTKEITKAYLIEINTTSHKGQYRTRGLYRFGHNFLFADLTAFNDIEYPVLVGDIADVFYVCHITSDDPFRIYFEAFLNSPLIRPGVTIDRLTQAQAFEQCIKNRCQELQSSKDFCDDLFYKKDSLGVNNVIERYDTEKVKHLSSLISQQYIPCSSFVLNKFKDYVKLNCTFSEEDLNQNLQITLD
jgi:hypothetical protein